MSGYTDSKGRYRKVAPGRTARVTFPECPECGYLGAPHTPDICARNKEWDRKRNEPAQPPSTPEENGINPDYEAMMADDPERYQRPSTPEGTE